jgi:thymidylate synthase (FAD)
MKKFKVKIMPLVADPQLLSAAGALSCFEEKSSAELMEDISALSEEERLKKEKGVLKNSFGRGHGSVGDQNYFFFCFEDIPRAATLQLCLPEYLSHLQQSLRRAKASRGFYLPEAVKNSEFGKKSEELLNGSFELYERMSDAGIPGEDARFILPLYTLTNIQSGGDAREWLHLEQMSKRPGVPSIVSEVVSSAVSQARSKAPYLFENFGFNYETLAWFPSSQLFSPANQTMRDLISRRGSDKPELLGSLCPIDITEEGVGRAIKDRDEAEISNLKRIHFEFLIPMSLACFHQATRQRTWNHSIESIYDAAETEGRMVVPPSVENSQFAEEFRNFHEKMMSLYKEMSGSGIPKEEAIGVVPHSLVLYDAIHINGWNVVHSIGKRTCVEAQWEIRRIAREIASLIKREMPALGAWAEPQCINYGYCPEIRDCGYYKTKKS